MRSSIWTLFTLALVASAGCAATTTAVNVHRGEVNTQLEASAAAIGHAEWLVNNANWEKVLTFREARAATHDGFLKVQITIENMSTAEVDFETMFEWLDRAGMKIRNYTERWTPGQVAARAATDVQGVAPSRDAVRYRLHLRPPVPVAETE